MEVMLRVKPLAAGESSVIAAQGPRSVRITTAPVSSSSSSSTMSSTAPATPSASMSTTGEPLPAMQEYSYDWVLAGTASQEETYRKTVLSSGLMKNFLGGTNTLLFCYGPSGSGKTYTVLGDPTGQQPGVLRRVLSTIFNYTQGIPEPLATVTSALINTPGKTPGASLLPPRPDGVKFTVWVSYLEIYNERLIDLLNPATATAAATDSNATGGGGGGGGLRIMEEKSQGRTFVKDLTEKPIQSLEAAMYLLNEGRKNRQVAETLLNLDSSRSHTVFTIKLAQVPANATIQDIKSNPEMLTYSKFSIVDLAGSERSSKSGISTEKAWREAGNINTSLLTLGRCIRAMRYNQQVAARAAATATTADASATSDTPSATPKGPGYQVVPFRDSKITRLFQDYFGGNSAGGKAVLIININPRVADLSETIQALNFGSVAKQIHLPVGAPSGATSTPSFAAKRSAYPPVTPSGGAAGAGAGGVGTIDTGKKFAPRMGVTAAAAAQQTPSVQGQPDSDSSENITREDYEALLDENDELRALLAEQEQRIIECEMAVRDEVAQEMARQLAEMETMFRVNTASQMRVYEDKYDNRMHLMDTELDTWVNKVDALQRALAESVAREHALAQQVAELQQQLADANCTNSAPIASAIYDTVQDDVDEDAMEGEASNAVEPAHGEETEAAVTAAAVSEDSADADVDAEVDFERDNHTSKKPSAKQPRSTKAAGAKKNAAKGTGRKTLKAEKTDEEATADAADANGGDEENMPPTSDPANALDAYQQDHNAQGKSRAPTASKPRRLFKGKRAEELQSIELEHEDEGNANKDTESTTAASRPKRTRARAK